MRYEQNVPVATFFETEGGLLNDHWKALSSNPDKIVLKPDVAKYQNLQDSGVLHNIVAYEEDKMVGYAVVFVIPHIHYADDKFAMVDVLYTDPNHRNSRLGITLINKVEEMCVKLEVSVLTYHTKPSHNTIEKILYRKGFTHFENILGKLFKGKTWE
jgi:GNAT superfamily N-acetyltransferase